jgi:hypothetical protein
MRRRVVRLERASRERRAAREVEERYRRSFERLRAFYHGTELPPEHPLGDLPGISVMIEQRNQQRIGPRPGGGGLT